MTLKVRTYLAEVDGRGISLFADQDIKEGALVWVHDPIIDGWLPDPEDYPYDDITRETFIWMYCYDKNLKKFIMFADNVRFINHSEDPNLDCPTKYIHYAARDIMAGEEITCNYNDVCDNGLGF